MTSFLQCHDAPSNVVCTDTSGLYDYMFNLKGIEINNLTFFEKFQHLNFKQNSQEPTAIECLVSMLNKSQSFCDRISGLTTSGKTRKPKSLCMALIPYVVAFL